MNKQTKNQEEKRAAFRRFSKMGAAGLAVLSMSAFTDVSAQQLQDNIKLDSVKTPLSNMITDTLFTIDELMLNKNESDTIQKGGRDYNYGGYSNYTNTYCNYFNYSNYSNNYTNYSNTYGDTGYSNNYTNSM